MFKKKNKEKKPKPPKQPKKNSLRVTTNMFSDFDQYDPTKGYNPVDPHFQETDPAFNTSPEPGYEPGVRVGDSDLRVTTNTFLDFNHPDRIDREF